MKKTIALLALAVLLVAGLAGAGEKVGVIQINWEHEYQQILKSGYENTGKKLGVDVNIEITDMSPEKTVRAAENLIAAGAEAIICAPADIASWNAVYNLCDEAGIYLLNDGSAQEIRPKAAPFIGTDSYAAGKKAAEYAAPWIKENYPNGVTVAHLTLPLFTDCVARNKGFVETLEKLTPSIPLKIVDENGKGAREAAMVAMENLLQGNPEIQVVFGCNDDSALGAMSAMQGANKDPKKTLLMGVDGTVASYEAIKRGGMFRIDVAQLPYTYAEMHMTRAVQLIRGEKKMEEFVKGGHIFMDPPAVTIDNVDAELVKIKKYLGK